jgi:hypothetical protein
MAIRLRPLRAEAVDTLPRLAHARTEPARVVERARLMWRAHPGRQVRAIAREPRRCHAPGRSGLQRGNGQGLVG